MPSFRAVGFVRNSVTTPECVRPNLVGRPTVATNRNEASNDRVRFFRSNASRRFCRPSRTSPAQCVSAELAISIEHSMSAVNFALGALAGAAATAVAAAPASAPRAKFTADIECSIDIASSALTHCAGEVRDGRLKRRDCGKVHVIIIRRFVLEFVGRPTILVSHTRVS